MKAPTIEVDIIRQRCNKRHKKEFRRQQSKPMREITTMIEFEVIRMNHSKSRCSNQPMQSHKFKND